MVSLAFSEISLRAKATRQIRDLAKKSEILRCLFIVKGMELIQIDLIGSQQAPR
jgi:hypothetical protein